MGLLKNLYTLWGFFVSNLVFFFCPRNVLVTFPLAVLIGNIMDRIDNFLVAYFIEIKSDFI